MQSYVSVQTFQVMIIRFQKPLSPAMGSQWNKDVLVMAEAENEIPVLKQNFHLHFAIFAL